MATEHTPHAKTETVTKARPAPVSSLPSGMPIADERVTVGKGAGNWLLVGAGAAILVLAIFIVAL